MHYEEKLLKNLDKTLYKYLPPSLQTDFVAFAKKERLSFQNLYQCSVMLKDLIQWDEFEKRILQQDLQSLKNYYEDKKNTLKSYDTAFSVKAQKVSLQTIEKESIGFGLCPVASPKTRCCNLLTLDVVESCGFDCSYCSIQSFYNENKVTFNTNLKQNLQALQLDPKEIYHIGTGQSSDSLMWGDTYDNLSVLNRFAKDNPNVILELKTKSDNISFFLKNEIAKNIIITWSLNPDTIIKNEEHLSASLQKRLDAAKKVQQKGILVGFHFHPMVEYKGYEKDYAAICQELIKNFDPNLTALVSLGTLTYIKPVIKKIRQRDFKSKILQMPLVDAGGKLSYPYQTKLKLFQTVYNNLTPWHKKVFFYLCMEDHSLWKALFNKEYPTNESFELDMKLHYKEKVDNLKRG